MTSTTTDTVYQALTVLPATVMFAKLIPPSIEASVFSLLTGCLNFANLFASRLMGNFVNLFVGVTDEDLNNVWKLYLYGMPLVLLPIAFVWLIPPHYMVKKV